MATTAALTTNGAPKAPFIAESHTSTQAEPSYKVIRRNGSVTPFDATKIVVALTIEAVGEALVFASKAGADPAKVRQALMGGLVASRILEVHGERMIKRTFAPGFRIELHQKDLNLALEGAKALGVSLPNTSTTQQLFNSCAANGGAGEDHSALVRALERMAAHQLGEAETQAKGKAT